MHERTQLKSHENLTFANISSYCRLYGPDKRQTHKKPINQSAGLFGMGKIVKIEGLGEMLAGKKAPCVEIIFAHLTWVYS
jgi:hypothetical protein